MDELGRPAGLAVVPASVYPLAWSPNAQWVVGGGRLTVVNAWSGQIAWTASAGTDNYDAAVSPDSRWVAAAGSPGSTGVFGLDNGAARFPPLPVNGSSVAYSPDGQRVAVISEPDGAPTATLMMIQADTGASIWSRDVAVINPLWFSPDGQSIAMATQSGALVVSPDGQDKAVIDVPDGVYRIGYSPDSRTVVTAGRDGFVRVFDVDGGRPGTRFRVDDNTIVGASFSADGRWIVAATPHAVGVFGALDGTPRFDQLFPVVQGRRVRYSPDLRTVAVSHAVSPVLGALTMLDARSGARLWGTTIDRNVQDIGYSPDGRLLAAGGIQSDGQGFVRVYETGLEYSRADRGSPVKQVEMFSGGIRLLASATASEVVASSVASGEETVRQPIPGVVTSLAFSSDGQVLATGSTDGVARLIPTLATGSATKQIAHGGGVNAIAFGGPGGQWVATASSDRTARVVERSTLAERGRYTHGAAVTQVLFGPGGAWVATGSADRKMRIIVVASGAVDAASGTEVFSLTSDGKVRALAVNPAGTVLATGNEDRTVTAVSVTGADGGALAAHAGGRVVHGAPVTAVAFSPEGRFVVSAADRTVLVTDVSDLLLLGAEEATPVTTLTCDSPVVALVFAPTRELAVITATGPVRVLDPVSGVDSYRLPHPAPVLDIAFSADGTLAATGCQDGIVRVFSLPTGPPA
jgi:WD40 repeat protein